MSIGWCLPSKYPPPSGTAAIGNEDLIELWTDAVTGSGARFAATIDGSPATWHSSWEALSPYPGGEPALSFPDAGVVGVSFFSIPGYGGWMWLCSRGTLTLWADGHPEILTASLMYGSGAYGDLVLTSESGGGGGGGGLPPIMALDFLTHIADGFAVDEAGVFARPQMGTGHSRLRRAYTVAERSVQIAWLLTDAQMVQVDDWYENALQGGNLAFSVPVKRQQSAEINAGAVAWWAAKWAEPPRCTPRKGGLWHYGGTLRLFGDQSDAGPATLPLAAEIALPLYGGAQLTVPQDIAASFTVALLELRSLGAVGFGVALVEA
jgi:hypothetical protein